MDALENPHAECPVADDGMLSALYDNNGDARNRADLQALRAVSAAAYADRAAQQESHRFGDADWQSFDVFRPASRAIGALVFVHGGRWQVNTSRETAFWAGACVDAGRLFIGINFPSRHVARLPAQVDAVRAAIEAAMAYTAGLDVAPSRVCVAGHSSGAHLALAALLRRPLDAGALLLLGGMYDLRPLQRTVHQQALQFDAAEVEASPQLVLTRAAQRNERCVLPPMLVAVGAEESSEFTRQARALLWILEQHTAAHWHVVPGAAHFDAALAFNAPHSRLRNFAHFHAP